MPIKTFSIGPLETNCYLIHSGETALVVDPGGDPQPVLEYAQENKLHIVAICLTHMHFDHLYGVAALKNATKADIYSPEDDAFLLQSEVGGGGAWGFPKVERFQSSPLKEGEHTFGTLKCTVLHTPGHSPGSMSLYFPEFSAVFTGDLLFYRAVGRTDLPGGDHHQLISSVRQSIFVLPDNTEVYPGHGPATTVGDEKHNNPYCGAFAR